MGREGRPRGSTQPPNTTRVHTLCRVPRRVQPCCLASLQRPHLFGELLTCHAHVNLVVKFTAGVDHAAQATFIVKLYSSFCPFSRAVFSSHCLSAACERGNGISQLLSVASVSWSNDWKNGWSSGS